MMMNPNFGSLNMLGGRPMQAMPVRGTMMQPGNLGAMGGGPPMSGPYQMPAPSPIAMPRPVAPVSMQPMGQPIHPAWSTQPTMWGGMNLGQMPSLVQLM